MPSKYLQLIRAYFTIWPSLKRLYNKSRIDETICAGDYGPEAWKRKEKLEFFAQLKAETYSEETTFKVLGLTRSRYYRWINAFKIHGIAGL